MSDRHPGSLRVRRSRFLDRHPIDRLPLISLSSCGTGLIQTTFLVMTLFRIFFYRHTGWMRTPVVSLVLRDGILVFLMLSSSLLPIYPSQFREVDHFDIFILQLCSPSSSRLRSCTQWGCCFGMQHFRKFAIE